MSSEAVLAVAEPINSQQATEPPIFAANQLVIKALLEATAPINAHQATAPPNVDKQMVSKALLFCPFLFLAYIYSI